MMASTTYPMGHCPHVAILLVILKMIIYSCNSPPRPTWDTWSLWCMRCHRWWDASASPLHKQSLYHFHLFFHDWHLWIIVAKSIASPHLILFLLSCLTSPTRSCCLLFLLSLNNDRLSNPSQGVKWPPFGATQIMFCKEGGGHSIT